MVSMVIVVAACGGGDSHALPPLAPMPPGPGWIGDWETSIGPLELRRSEAHDIEPEDAAEFPIAGSILRGQSHVHLLCRRPHENHLSCAWDEVPYVGRDGPIDSGVMVLVMKEDGASFVANLGSRERTVRVTGQRIP